MTIRAARPGDAEALSGLLGELGHPASRAEVIDRLGRLDARDPVFVAESDGTVVGLIAVHVGPQLHRARPVARITAIVVTEGMRGRDWGLRLIQHALDLARERGCGMVELTSRTERESAHGFYEAAGFVRTAHRFSRDL